MDVLVPVKDDSRVLTLGREEKRVKRGCEMEHVLVPVRRV
jgi:hypothetical protein